MIVLLVILIGCLVFLFLLWAIFAEQVITDILEMRLKTPEILNISINPETIPSIYIKRMALVFRVILAISISLGIFWIVILSKYI